MINAPITRIPTGRDLPNLRLRSRRGAVMIVALTAAAIVSTLIAAGISVSLRQRQERKTERDRVQLEFLCDAGVARGMNQFRSNPSYQGEHWLEIDGLTEGARMTVDIEIVDRTNEATSASDRRSLVVRARIEGRTHTPHAMQTTCSVPLPL